MLLLLSTNAYSADPGWLACRNEPSERQLACYQQATDQYLTDNRPMEKKAEAAAEVSTPNYDWKTDRLWPLPQEMPDTRRLANTFLQYKQNYLLADLMRNPNETPNSPNPLNNVLTPSPAKGEELKFQISLKGQLPLSWPWGDTLWFTYTQQSHWQAFNGNNSRPFRETNYMPELIFLSHRFDDRVPTLGALTPRLLNLSYIHQSNGETLPESRSWNRLTAQIGSEYRFKDSELGAQEKKLTVTIRPWWRIPEDGKDDDNPDITKYMGHGDLEIGYWHGRQFMTAVLRSRAVQLDWSYPLSAELNALNFHLQYFNGYGESLIDYNHKLHSFGIGFSLPY